MTTFLFSKVPTELALSLLAHVLCLCPFESPNPCWAYTPSCTASSRFLIPLSVMPGQQHVLPVHSRTAVHCGPRRRKSQGEFCLDVNSKPNNEQLKLDFYDVKY